jgi:hypothetical protein
MALDQALHAAKKSGQLAACGAPMPEVAESFMNGCVGMFQDEPGGGFTHALQDFGDASQNLMNPAIGKGRGDHPHDFTVQGVVVVMQEFQWIRVDEFSAIIERINLIERLSAKRRRNTPSHEIRS